MRALGRVNTEISAKLSLDTAALEELNNTQGTTTSDDKEEPLITFEKGAPLLPLLLLLR